jgi:hypothetical protein
MCILLLSSEDLSLAFELLLRGSPYTEVEIIEKLK